MIDDAVESKGAKEPSKQPKLKPPQSQTLSTPNPEETIEFTLPHLEIPLKRESDEKGRSHIIEPSEEVLREFFTPENIQRLIYCPQINNDELDGWGMFGYAPGYIFVIGREYEGERSLNDRAMLSGSSFKNVKTKTGKEVLTISHYDYFPQMKFSKQLITMARAPKTFFFLRELLEGVKKDDLSTYTTDDLDDMARYLRKGPNEGFLEEAKKLRSAVSTGFISEDKATGALNSAESYEKMYRDQQKRTPENVKEYLEIVNVVQNREEIPNPGALRLKDSFDTEQEFIQQAIDQAKEQGDNELADSITELQKNTIPYRRDLVYLPPSEKTKKLPE